MKKLFLSILVFGLLLGGNGYANGIKELNKKLLEIEKRIDICLSTKDKDICGKFALENPFLLEIFGNADFAKLLSSSKCEIGTKCAATNARLAAKMFQLQAIVMETD